MDLFISRDRSFVRCGTHHDDIVHSIFTEHVCNVGLQLVQSVMTLCCDEDPGRSVDETSTDNLSCEICLADTWRAHDNETGQSLPKASKRGLLRSVEFAKLFFRLVQMVAAVSSDAYGIVQHLP